MNSAVIETEQSQEESDSFHTTRCDDDETTNEYVEKIAANVCEVTETDLSHSNEEVTYNNNKTKTTVLATLPATKIALALHSKWSIWFDHPKLAPAGSDWKENLKLCGTFQTVEGLWRIFNNLKPAASMRVSSNYSVFRYGVEPSWEDPTNCDGGKFVLTIPKKEGKAGRTNECWLLTILAIVGETMDVSGNQVNGAVASMRKHEDRIALWTKSSEKKVCTSIGTRWKKVLCLEKISLKFINHRAAAATGRSFRNDSQFEV